MTQLSPVHIKVLEARGISGETAVKYGLFTGRRSDDGSVYADAGGNVLVFPYIERDIIVNEKYRAPVKKFWQRTGGRKTFWNADVLDDPALIDGSQPLIITEGELDALAAIEARFPMSVSVPDGAPPVPKGQKPDDLAPLDESQDPTGKFEFMWNNRDRLARIKRFIIAVDNDGPGQRLAAELVRRLLPSRCMFVTYPEGCKDLNDVLKDKSIAGVVEVLNHAKPYPVHGLYKLGDYPPSPSLQTFSTGWELLDHHLQIYPGEFMVVTGIPGMGKSTWTMNLLVNLYQLYGWRSAVYSPEMPTLPYMRDKLRRIIGGQRADDVIHDAFTFVDVDPTGKIDEEFTIGLLIKRGVEAVMRDGIKVFLIDPWNEVEHARERGEMMTDYISRAIRDLKRFARQYEVAVIVIVHPNKDVFDKGKSRMPTLYDCDGSASWFNKPDHGVCVHREDPTRNETTICVQKVRFDETGKKGSIKMAFEETTCRYMKLDQQDMLQEL